MLGETSVVLDTAQSKNNPPAFCHKDGDLKSFGFRGKVRRFKLVGERSRVVVIILNSVSPRNVSSCAASQPDEGS